MTSSRNAEDKRGRKPATIFDPVRLRHKMYSIITVW